MAKIINALFDEIEQAVLEIEKKDSQLEFRFNGYSNYIAYLDFISEMCDEFVVELQAEIAGKNFKAEAVYLLSTLERKLLEQEKTFSELKYIDLPDIAAVFETYFKDKPHLKKPKEFTDNLVTSKERTILKMTPINVDLNEINNNEIQNFLFKFMNLQYNVVDFCINEIGQIKNVIAELSNDDYSNKKVFYKLGFLDLNLKRKPMPKVLDFTIEALDIRQSALLYSYMEQLDLYLKYNNSDKAKLCSSLTGHSEHNLRTDKGFPYIERIKSDLDKDQNFADVKLYNLTSVKKQVEKLLELINDDIEKQQ